MLIDICIAFNEKCPGGRIGFVKKDIGMWDQLDALLNSIEKNWDRDKLDYRTHVFHSEPLLGDHYEILKKRCDNLVFDNTDLVFDKNRGHVYKHNFGGDYTLVLGTDTLILNMPKFEFEKEIYASPGSLMSVKLSQWEALYNLLGIEYQVPDKHPINLNRLGKPFFSVGINDDCVFIKNSIKGNFWRMLIEWGERVEEMAKQPHFGRQILHSLIFKKFNYGYLNGKMNYYPFKHAISFDMEKEVEILHYLGHVYSSYPEVREIVSKYGRN